MKINYNEPIKYIGKEEININRHDGQLRPAVGVNNIQVLRSNREHPEEAEGTGWTYNHAPMLAYHNNKFYLEYLSTPVDEHRPPGHTLLTISNDGLQWSTPEIIFPQYPIPDGLFKYDGNQLPDGSFAVMHQRMGFYEAPNGKLLVLGNYGICPTINQVPFDRFSIGRVVREIYPDDSLGPIYFIRYNVNTIWNESNTNYPLYTCSEDPAFVEACNMLLANPLVTQQWAEEQGDADEYITVKSKDGGAFYNKAFCWYKLDDGSVVGLWKWMKSAISHDEGKTWSDVALVPTIKHAGSKIWGQRTPDGSYALVYNPHTNNLCRWPLAVVTSNDGLTFDNMLCVIGDVSPMRYFGAFKEYGFNYVRGIENKEGQGPDDAVYVVYSMNKEDIWLSRIPTPITGRVNEDIYDNFRNEAADSWVRNWNIYSPKWASVGICEAPDHSGNCLKLEDYDPYDYAKAERVFKEGSHVKATIQLMAGQKDCGELYLEMCDAKGNVPLTVLLNGNGELRAIHGRKNLLLTQYEPSKWYELKIIADVENSSFDVVLDGKSLSSNQAYQGQATGMKGWFFTTSVNSLERLTFRTGPVRKEPLTDWTWNSKQEDYPGAGEKDRKAAYFIKQVEIVSE